MTMACPPDLRCQSTRRLVLQRALGCLGSLAAATPTAFAADARPGVETVAQGLVSPWGLAFLPDGSYLATEKPGRVRRVMPNGQLRDVRGVPAVVYSGQGGLLDVALDPAFGRPGGTRWVYLSYAEAGRGAEAGKSGTAVSRARLADDGSALTDLQVIFRQAPKASGGNHFGGRLCFAKDGTLFVTLGDRFALRDEAQNPANHLGKVVRIRPDGSVPPDNPFVGRPGAASEIWSVGHRNVQGAALHPQTGELWVCEHGPQGGDEINIARRGRNYGWPVITYGREYGSGRAIGEGTVKDGMEQPLTTWVPKSIAPSGLAFCTSDRYPASWRGSAFVGALAGQALWRLTLSGDQITGREALLQDLGERIRDVRQGPDGWLYLLTDSNDGRLLRVRA